MMHRPTIHSCSDKTISIHHWVGVMQRWGWSSRGREYLEDLRVQKWKESLLSWDQVLEFVELSGWILCKDV